TQELMHRARGKGPPGKRTRRGFGPSIPLRFKPFHTHDLRLEIPNHIGLSHLHPASFSIAALKGTHMLIYLASTLLILLPFHCRCSINCTYRRKEAIGLKKLDEAQGKSTVVATGTGADPGCLSRKIGGYTCLDWSL